MQPRLRTSVSLSERQKMILDHFLMGKTQKQISLDLGIAASTIGTHLGRIRKRFGVRTNRQLYALSANTLNEPAEMAILKADVASLEAWRTTLLREISFVTTQRDSYLRELQELRDIPAVQQVLARIGK